MTKGEKISLLRREAQRNDEAASLLNVIGLYYPRLLDSPESSTAGMLIGYNRLVDSNITNPELRENLTMLVE